MLSICTPVQDSNTFDQPKLNLEPLNIMVQIIDLKVAFQDEKVQCCLIQTHSLVDLNISWTFEIYDKN